MKHRLSANLNAELNISSAEVCLDLLFGFFIQYQQQLVIKDCLHKVLLLLLLGNKQQELLDKIFKVLTFVVYPGTTVLTFTLMVQTQQRVKPLGPECQSGSATKPK